MNPDIPAITGALKHLFLIVQKVDMLQEAIGKKLHKQSCAQKSIQQQQLSY